MPRKRERIHLHWLALVAVLATAAWLVGNRAVGSESAKVGSLQQLESTRIQTPTIAAD